MRLDESFLNDLARDNLVEQPMRIDIEGVAPPSAPGEADLTQTATEMAAGMEPPGATPMTMGEFATSVADVPAGLLKGAVQGTVGLPGDIESLTYGVRELFNRRADEGALDAFLRGLEQKTILPTTENVKKWLDENVGTLVPAGASERRTQAAKIPEFVGELGGAGKTVIEASKAAGRGLGQVTGASTDMAARTPAMQAGSVKPSAFMPSRAAPAAEPQRSNIGFYSAVEKAVLDSKQDKGTGAQFLAQITKTQGVKPEELKWTGLDEFLKGKKSVTKQEIQDYLNANRVDVREVRLGGDAQFTSPDEALNYLAARRGGTVDGVIEDYGYTDNQDYVTLANNIYRTLDSTSTKFSQYTLPGGENYREILLTLPARERVVETQVPAGKRPKVFEDTATGRFELLDSYGETRAVFNTRAEAEQAADEIAAPFVKSETVKDLEFYSTHFDQPNILAHMRVNDRVVDGKKTLFIEEIQSDWHQTGRKKGYSEPGKPFEVFNPRDGNVISRFATEREAREYANRLGRQVDYARSEDVPDAPFKTSWHELTLKRAIQEASEKGYDQIAFTTGKTQAERYDLSKQVDELLYKKNPDGTYRLSAQVRGRGQSFGDSIPESKLEEYVGKEVAKSITQGSGKDVNLGGPGSFTQPRDDWKSMSGLDLKVGGEGMKGFYDNILPKSLEKIGKKFDAKVGKTEMDGVEVWQMDITPKMRETVTKQGQPLFQIGVGGGAAAGAATMQQPGEQM